MVRRGVALLLLLLMLSLSGCWSRREITETAFVGIMGLDRVGQQYRVTVNTLLAWSGGTQGTGGMKTDPNSKPVWTVRAEASTLNEAFGRLQRLIPRRLFLGQLRSVFIGEDLAREGIATVLSYLSRLGDIRPTVWVGIAPGRAEELLQARPALESYPGNGPMGYHDLAHRVTSMVPALHLATVIADLNEPGRDVFLPVYRLSEMPDNPQPEPESGRSGQEAISDGAAVFHAGKLTGWLNSEATRGLLLARGETALGMLAAPCPSGSGKVVFRLNGNSSRVRVSHAGTTLAAAIDIRIRADISEVECDFGPVTVSDLEAFRGALASEVSREVKTVMRVMQETHSDLIGLGQVFYRRSPAEFRKLEPMWDQVIAEMPLQVTVDAGIPRTGQLHDVMRGQGR